MLSVLGKHVAPQWHLGWVEKSMQIGFCCVVGHVSNVNGERRSGRECRLLRVHHRGLAAWLGHGCRIVLLRNRNKVVI